MTLVELGNQVLALVAPAVLAAVGAVATAALLWLRRKLRVEAVAAERAEFRTSLRAGAAAAEEAGARDGLTSAEKSRMAIAHALAQNPDVSLEELARELDGQLAMMAGVGATGSRVVFPDAGPTDPARPTP